MRRAQRAIGFAAIGGTVKAGVQHVHRVLHLGVGIDARIVKRALAQTAVFAGHLPGGAAVIGNEDAAIFVFHNGVDALPIRARDRNADLADDARGQSRIARNFRPVVAAIGGLEEAACRSAARQTPRRAIRIPDGREEHVRVGRIERQVHGAGAIVAVENPLPGLSAVLATEDAAFRVGPIRMAERGDVDDIGIGGVHANARDRLRIAQADVLPGLAGVGRFVHTVALHHVTAQFRLAHPDVDHIRIRSTHRHRAH